MIDMLFAGAFAPLLTLVTIPPPPVIRTPTASPVTTVRQQSLAILQPIDGRCADGPLDIESVEKPAAQLLWGRSEAFETPTILNFRIDENGRVLGIKRDPSGYGVFPDLSPSLAASRFPSGKPRNRCVISYSTERTSIADAKIDDLIAYSIFPGISEQRPPNELFDRLQPEGSDCYPQRPAVLLQAYPDFERIRATPGRTDWSMIKFDIDVAGKPLAIGTHATTGNTALDKASIDAIAKSRYARGKKMGCLYPYWRGAATLSAPQIPETEAYQSGERNCPANIEWRNKPALVYPDSFRRRGIEGWAIVAFDVAPWGATGNVKIVAAEPATEFGDAALNIVAGATVATSEQGYSGCFEKVRYVRAAKPTTDERPAD